MYFKRLTYVMPHLFKLTRILLIALLFIGLIPNTTTVLASSCGTPNLQEASFTLDNVEVSLCTPFLPSKTFTTSDPGDAIQAASAFSLKPFKEFSVETYPMGQRFGGPGSMVATNGSEDGFRKEIENNRKKQGGSTVDGPTIEFFGKKIKGLVTQVNLNLDTSGLKPTLIIEWSVEAGERLWIIRVSTEQKTNDVSPLAVFVNSFSELTVKSPYVDAPTTLFTKNQTNPNNSINQLPVLSVASDLPQAPWWKDNNKNYSDCDAYHYTHSVNNPSSTSPFRLGSQIGQTGAVYRNVPACGPRPLYDNPKQDVLVSLPGYGEYEWECVELVMRFMNLAFGTLAYSSPGGKDVVNNYPGNNPNPSAIPLTKVANGTIGKAPQQNDIISFGPTASNSLGHTAVVTSSNVDNNGKGTITIIEQNNSANGIRTLNVSGWVVSNATIPYGWLHDDSSTPIEVGQGSYLQPSFVDAYNRASGAGINLGNPTNAVHEFDGTSVQDFSSGGAIDHDTAGNSNLGACKAFYMGNGVYRYYLDLNGPAAKGAPTSDQFLVGGTIYQSFSAGIIQYNPNTWTDWPNSGTGWKKEYYNNRFLACGRSWVEYTDPSTSFDYSWGDFNQAPIPFPGVVGTDWSARYSRTINFEGGNYNFTAGSDDGVAVYLDGTSIISQWVDRSYTTNTDVGRYVSPGNHVINIDYYNISGGGRLSFTYNLNVPPPPTNLSATPASQTQINLNWSASSNATGYKIERKTGIGGSYAEIAGSVTGTSYSDTGLNPNTGYYYRVRASNSAGLSGYSNEANATTNSITYPIGQGSAYQSLFQDAYNHYLLVNPTANLGQPLESVHLYKSGIPGYYVQKFDSGMDIFHEETLGADSQYVRAYVVPDSLLSNTQFISIFLANPANNVPTSGQFLNVNASPQVNVSGSYYVWQSGSWVRKIWPWPTAVQGWKTQYFNNAYLLGGPSFMIYEGSDVNLDFSHTEWQAYTAPRPDRGLEYEDNWSARWERTYSFNPGTYNFTLCGDDGVRLYLDGALVINQWQVQALTCYTHSNTFNNATSIPLKIEYYQGNGGAGISFSVTASPLSTPGYSSNPAPGSTLNFGSSTIGTAINTSIIISEVGNATLNVSNPTISGTNASDFAVVSPTFPLNIADGAASQQVTVSCIPSASGSRVATLSFSTNDPSKATVSYNLNCTGSATTPLTLVTTGIDNGGPGTFSYVLANVSNGQTINFAAGVTTITFTSGHAALPALKPGVTLQGQCGANGPQVIIDGSGVTGNGLTLQGGNHLYGIWIKGFGGKQLLTSGTGNVFTQSCVKVTKS